MYDIIKCQNGLLGEKGGGVLRIIGIDPGYAIVGVGVVDYVKNKFYPVKYGAVDTPAGTPFEVRLKTIYETVRDVIAETKPECMSIERLYFNNNQKTAIDVAEARGVILLAAIEAGIPIFEYTPLQIKQSLVGYGRAEKHQVQIMVRDTLRLEAVPKPDDTADALAAAICHGYSHGSLLSKVIKETR